MSNIDQRLTPRATIKWLFFYQCKIVALAYAISLVPLSLKMAHVVAVEGFVLWLLLSTIYTVWYRRHRNVPEAVDIKERTSYPKEVNYVRRYPIKTLYGPVIRPHHVRFMGSGKEPPCWN